MPSFLSGFEGCASSREFYWHLASDREDQWNRFPRAQSYKWHPDQGREFKLFSDEAAWTLSPSYYLSNELFTRPLPDANYATLVVSTGGHWTTTLFSGYRDESKADEGYGIDGVIAFFRQVMDHWASQDTINSDMGVVATAGRRKRQTLVRAY
uniref:Uncharacterized protein n=1 Tax=Moniliophthora roreri TaxID=221103 RepID=A0A0W0G6C6_MONRR